jgi:hypothetical protein
LSPGSLPDVSVRPANRRTALVVACGVLGVVLLWVPFFRMAYGNESVSLWALRDQRPRGFWIGVVDVALLLAAALGSWRRRVAFGCGVAAVAVTLVIGFVAASRVEFGSACFGYMTSRSSSGDCTRVGTDYVPSLGWALALILGVASTLASAGGVRPSGLWLRHLPASRALTEVTLGAAAVVVAAAFLPVFRRDGLTFEGQEYPGYLAGQTVLHSPYAVAALLLAVTTAGLVLAGRAGRAETVAGALITFITALAAGAALPVGDGIAHRRVDGVRTAVSITRLGWAYPVVLAGSIVVLAASVLAYGVRVSGDFQRVTVDA